MLKRQRHEQAILFSWKSSHSRIALWPLAISASDVWPLVHTLDGSQRLRAGSLDRG